MASCDKMLSVKYSLLLKIKKSKREGKDQKSIQTSTTSDTGHRWESDNFTFDITNESQDTSHFQAGDHKASINRRAKA